MNALPRTGEQFAHYRILEKLGQGGMGEVYRAHDEHLHRDVAIKVLPAENLADGDARARLVREARAAAALNHPFICTVHEVGEAGGQAYIAMELVEGQTLAACLAPGPLPVEKVIRYGIQLAEALGHAHDRGVLHRDLKSANVIVTPAGRVKVLDFGLAKRLNSSELTTGLDVTAMGPGNVAGTLPYMAPEQLRGQPAQAVSDVWALGVVLYEMAEGTRPFQGQTSFEVSAAILGQAPAPFAASIPAGLQSIIVRCLEKEPAQRYKSGSEACAALEMLRTKGDRLEIPDTRPIVPVAPEPARHTRGALIGRRQIIWLGAAAVAVAAAVTVWQSWPATVVAQRSLAILPLQNVQGDEALDHVSQGISEGLIRQVSQIRTIRVVALRRVLDYKSEGVDTRDIGRQLNVENLLSGTLTREGRRLKIELTLAATADARTLWSHTYDLDAARLLDTQEEIVAAIMDEGLRVRLGTAERQRMLRHPTTDPEAYEYYMQARHLQRRGTEDDYLRSKELLERAIQRDENFSLAYAAMSAIYAMLVVDGFMRPTDAWPEVDKYLRKAVRLDPDFPDASGYEHAQAFFFYWNWEAAEQARQKALQARRHSFDPDDLRALAIERWALGHADEALAMVKRSREQDPLNAYMASVEGDYLVKNGQLDAAIALYKESIRLEPANDGAYFGLAEAYDTLGRFEEASDYRRQAHAIAGHDAIADAFALAKGKGEAGYRQADRQWVLLQLELYKERAKTKYTSPLDFARVYAQLGEKDQAFRYLREAYNDRSPGMALLNVDRAFDNVRGDPRFLEMVRQVGLPAPLPPPVKTP